MSRVHRCTCSRAWSTNRGRCSVCKGERVGAEQLELGPDMIGHLIYYPHDDARGLVFDHPTAADTSGRCGGAVIWRNVDGSPGRYTVVVREPLELAEPILCRCGLAGYIRNGRWVATDELGRPHSKGRQRQVGADRRAPAELEHRMHHEVPS